MFIQEVKILLINFKSITDIITCTSLQYILWTVIFDLKKNSFHVVIDVITCANSLLVRLRMSSFLCFFTLGGIISTANDMARWMNMLLSGGLNEAGEEVFSSDVIRETQSPVNGHASEGRPQYHPPEYVFILHMTSASFCTIK